MVEVGLHDPDDGATPRLDEGTGAFAKVEPASEGRVVNAEVAGSTAKSQSLLHALQPACTNVPVSAVFFTDAASGEPRR